MKRLFYVAVCLAVLTLSGCANGLTGCGNTCNQGGLFSGGMFQGNGPFADGPVRQWFRGDECNTCNPAAGQASGCNMCDSNTAASCSSCGQGVPMNDPYAQPAMGQPIMGQPIDSYPQSGLPSAPGPIQGNTINSFYPNFSGSSLSDPGAIDGGSVLGNESFTGGNLGTAIEPPYNGSINMN